MLASVQFEKSYIHYYKVTAFILIHFESGNYSYFKNFEEIIKNDEIYLKETNYSKFVYSNMKSILNRNNSK